MNNSDQRRKELYSLLGDLPDRNLKISAEKIDEIKKEHYILEKLNLSLNGIEDVPAYFIKPTNQDKQTPCVLYNHWHGGMYNYGKTQLIDNQTGNNLPAYAEVFAELGVSALCIDHWVFGERSGREEQSVFKEMIWNGQVLWGMMVYDSLKALDYISTRNDVDTSRIATLGMSMGSTMAWWIAALDTRIKVCVDICCLTDYEALIESNGLHTHGIYYFVPKLMKHFTASEINSLIAPRPHLGVAGIYDTLTPLKGLDKIDNDLKEVYKQAECPEAWKLSRYNCGHMETAKMRTEIIEFLKKWL